MELFKRIDKRGRSKSVSDLLAKVRHVELAGDWDETNIKDLRGSLKFIRQNIDAIMCFVKAYETIEDEEIPICISDIRRRSLAINEVSGKLLRSFQFESPKEKVAWLASEYRQLVIDVEGLCLATENEADAVAVEAAL